VGTQGKARPDTKRGWPLQADFAVIAILVLLVGVAAGAFVHLRSEADAKKAAVLDAGYAAERAAKQIKFGFDTYESVTAPLAKATAWAQVFADPTLCSISYAPIASFDTGHVDVIRMDGRVVCSSLGKGSKTTYAGQAWLEATKPTFAAPLVDAATGNQVAVYAYPIPGLGFIVWFVDLKPLGPKLAYEYGSGTHQLEFLVVGPTGEGSFIVARSENSAKWTGAKLAGTPFSRASDPVDRNDVDGKPRWYAVANVEGAGWQVYVGADQAAALAAAAGLQNEQFAVLGAGLIAVLIAVLIVYRRIAKPIQQLSESVRSSRTLDTPILVPEGGPAQVADLAQDFNRLITSVQREWTERASAERDFLRLFESSPLPIMFIEPTTGKFLRANDSAASAFGYSKEEFVGLSALDVLAPKDEAELAQMEAARQAALGKSLVRYGPLTVRKKDGTLMRILSTSYEVSYEGRSARAAMVEDVTTNERIERQLNQAQRLESLGQLAGGVAHDFNNLLGVILNFALFAKEKVLAKEKLLASEGGAPSSELQQAAKDMDRVVRAAESAARLTHQLLAFARREVTRPESLDVNSVVAELEPLVSRAIGEHIEFVTSPGKDLWPALMDPAQLEQVLTNLVVNARDAMPKGGKLVIDCENVYVDEAYATGRPGLKPGRYVRIRVTDTGTGMDGATLRRVFEPFFTTKPKGQGTGLGLATVHGIVNQAGGDISIYSELGSGTRVHVLLPAADEAPKPLEVGGLKPRLEATATILVVEDADDLRDITERILTKAGYRVITAANGAAALEVVKGHAGTIDLLLTDVVMPQMHGPDLAKHIRAAHPEIRVLFMSGYAQPMLENGGALEDGVLLIEKPFTAPVLLDGVEHALRTTSVATAHK
jgi:PAS domain S-box-containing protein